MDSTVFDSTLQALREIHSDCIEFLARRLAAGFRESTAGYRQHRTICKEGVGEILSETSSYDVSAEFCDGLACVRSGLNACRGCTSETDFDCIWRRMAGQLCEIAFEELLKAHVYTRSGALQLQVDLGALWGLFGPYTRKPENHFKLVKESCILLALEEEPLQNLRALLSQWERCEAECIELLASHGVYKLDPMQADSICMLRES